MMRDSVEAASILIVPGLGGSGSEHWQSRWQRSYPPANRVEQADWNKPVRADWLSRLAQALRNAPGAILVGHSLGCALIAQLACRHPDLSIGGALLVAPADVDDGDRTPARRQGFRANAACTAAVSIRGRREHERSIHGDRTGARAGASLGRPIRERRRLRPHQCRGWIRSLAGRRRAIGRTHARDRGDGEHVIPLAIRRHANGLTDACTLADHHR